MKGFRILLYVAGIIILGACAYMVYGLFTTPSVFWLDTAVVLFLYTLNIWGIKSLFMSSERFGKEITAYGIILTTQLIYSLLAIAGILTGFFMEIVPAWQFIYQASFLLFLGLGSYMALSAVQRQQKVGMTEQQNQKPLLNLKEKTDLLKFRANSSIHLTTAQKQQISELMDRIDMLSPNSSPMATMMETELANSLDTLLQLVSATPISISTIKQNIATLQSQVSERMKLVTT